MGERYCQLLYGALESEMPECPGPYEPGDPDNNWSNWVSGSPGVKYIVEETEVAWDSSYESEPRVIGFKALSGGGAYATWDLAGSEVSDGRLLAAETWERFRNLVRKELSLEIPAGRMFLVFDHT